MLIVDFIVLAFVAYGFYLGLKKGLFVAVASFLSFLIGLIGALKFSTIIKEYLYASFKWDSTLLPFLSFVLTFVLVILLVRMVASLMTEAFKAVYLGLFNRIFGGVFEVLRVILLACLVFALFDKVNINHFMVEEATLKTSFFYSFYEGISGSLFPSLFELFDRLFEKSVEIITSPSETQTI